VKINGHVIDISNRDKIFFPKVGLTKGDLIEYYVKIADVMLPYLKRYPVSMQRYPDGIEAEGWYAKDTPDYFPEWIKRVNFPKKEGGRFIAPMVISKAGLVYLADQAVLTLHTYLSPASDLEHPDKMVYDLDPPENTEDYAAVRNAALSLHEILGELDLQAWVQTTGSSGYHVVVPLKRSWAFNQVKDFAEDVAKVLIRRNPQKFTLEQRINKRQGRIYLDTNRNAYGATVVAPYSVRVRPQAPVATPVEWDEVKAGANPRDWTVKNVFRRLGQKPDPWRDMMQHAQNLDHRMEKLSSLLIEEQPAEEET
jgi:bifunctional non-homologous end joining protein LigD